MRVVILTSFPFPHGKATANRISVFAERLIKRDEITDVIIVSCSHLPEADILYKDNIRVINLQSILGDKNRLFLRAWHELSIAFRIYKKAKSFMAYKADLETLYMNDWEFLCDLNIEVISMMLRWMDIQTPLLRSSQMKATGNASDLVLNLCLEVGATNYLSGHGGEGYLKPDVFKSSGIDIIYQDYFQTKIYPQQSPQCGFIHDLSMLDIILNCGESWRNFLHSKVVL